MPPERPNMMTSTASRSAQDDIGSLRSILGDLLRGHSVLEVACGTGFWTREIAVTASHIHATDVNDSVLEIASERLRLYRNVTFGRDDAFALIGTSGVFTAAFAGFWWSHVARGEQLSRFLNVLHAKLQPGALVVFTDNRFTSRAAISRSPERTWTGTHTRSVDSETGLNTRCSRTSLRRRNSEVFSGVGAPCSISAG